MILNITNDLNYMLQNLEGNPEERRRHEDYVKK
jgi:hypothetical protein